MRTAAVVASIAVGVFAFGTIAGAGALLDAAFEQAYADGNPASVTMYTATGFEPELVEAVERMDGVAVAQARRTVSAWLERGAGAPGAGAGAAPLELQLIALPDFEDQRIDRVLPRTGEFPPQRGEIVFERSAQRLTDVGPADDVTVRTASGRERRLRVAGLAYEPGASPAYYFGRLSAYVTRDTLVDLGWPETYNELRVRTDPGLSAAETRTLADAVRQRIERTGTPVTFTLVAPPGRHPAKEIVDAVFLVLGAIGLLSLIVAGFLIVNTVNVLMAQHVRQIGIMKVVGAGAGQVASLYLVLVGLYALAGVAIAIPLAAVASVGLATFAAGLLNVDLAGWLVPAEVMAWQAAAGVLVALAAAVVPIRRGVRITVHRALVDTGMDEHFGRGAFDRLLAGVSGLSRPMLLSIRSTFRRKGRLALTLGALTLGGAVFMTTFNVRGSLYATFAATARYFDYDVQVQLAEPARSATAVAEAMRVPGTVAAEPWQFSSAIRQRPDGTESPAMVVFGLPAGAETVEPVISEGRWLLPGEGNAIVVTSNIRRDEPDLQVGDALSLRIAGVDADWTVVGIVESPTFAVFVYADEETLGRTTGGAGRAGMVMVRTETHDAASQAASAQALRDHLEASGIDVASVQTTSDVMTTLYAAFDTLVVVVSAMAVLLALVGGLGLAGTMTMNVIERSREIGIMRAVGASDAAVRRVFVGEGLVIGLLAWVAGAILSLPLSRVLADQLGQVFVQRPLSFEASITGLGIWLGVVLAMSALGSLGPAWRASRVTVRQVLGYE
jgi:putative ABC transport system permease protein